MRFITKGSIGLEASRKGIEEMQGVQNPISWAEGVNVAFKKPIHKILEKIKHKPYFRWPSKMGEDPTSRNQNL